MQYWTNLEELVVTTACAFHDASGAIRHGMRQFAVGKDNAFYKDLHVGVAALRNSYDLLTSNMILLLSAIVWDDPDDPFDVVLRF